MYLESLGQPMLILISAHHAFELLEKRSSNYSDRPCIFILATSLTPRADLRADNRMLHLTGWMFNIALMPYGDMWRRRRRMMQNHLHKKALDSYRQIQYDVTKVLLKDLLQAPNDFGQHIRK